MMWLFRKMSWIKRMTESSCRLEQNRIVPHLEKVTIDNILNTSYIYIRGSDNKSLSFKPEDLYLDIDLLSQLTAADVAIINGLLLQHQGNMANVKFIEFKNIIFDENNERQVVCRNHVTKKDFREPLKQLTPSHPLLSLIPSHQAEKLSSYLCAETNSIGYPVPKNQE